jgi:tetratricopeptide (TPR) repeat protein
VPTANLQGYESKLNEPTDVARQTAAADAAASSQWEGTEGSALADISMLALALFLLGLTLTITHRPTAVGFVALAGVIVLVAVVRLGIVGTHQVDVPTASAISAYANGNQDLATGDYNGAIASFRQAVTTSPGYEAAWEQLAYADFNLYTPAGFSASDKDYQHALSLKPAQAGRGPLLNDLGFSQLVSGQVPAAGATLLDALKTDPTDEVTLASLAEQATLAHDPSRADGYLAQTLGIVQKHGPYFREQFFQSFRSDQSTFYVAGVPSSVTDPFYLKVKEAEASLDSLGSPQPGDAHGATVTNLSARPVGTQGLATMSFDYDGFQPGDHLAIRWYQDGVTYELTDSLPNTVLDSSWQGSGSFNPDQYVVPVTAGSQTVEVYLNGVLLSSQTFTMPAATS